MATAPRRSTPATPARGRLAVTKTYKLFIGGAFPRSESGRSYAVTSRSGEHLANVAWASRKDARDAVRAARGAVAGWSTATAYNRGQVLYRVAEMLEGRREQFIAELQSGGSTPAAAEHEVDAAIDFWVHVAGWSDKFAQVTGSANPVAAPYFNFSMPEPTGVVALLAPQDGDALLGLVRLVAPAIVTGNAVVVAAHEANPLPALTFAEVLATSDVPKGVVNILTGPLAELATPLAGHMDVNAIDLAGAEASIGADLEALAAENLKRVVRPRSTRELHSEDALAAITRSTELKTVWHPIGV